jgi:hypothetical protein
MSTPKLSEILKSPDMVRTINEILASLRKEIVFRNHTAKILDASIINDEWLIINITTSQGPMHVPINLTQNNKSYIRSYIKFGEFNNSDNSDNSLKIVLETLNDSKSDINITFKDGAITNYIQGSGKFSNKNDLEDFIGLVVTLISSLNTILNYAITRELDRLKYVRVQPQSRVLSSQIYQPNPYEVFNLRTFEAPFLQKYLKYKQKYLELKKNLEK